MLTVFESSRENQIIRALESLEPYVHNKSTQIIFQKSLESFFSCPTTYNLITITFICCWIVEPWKANQTSQIGCKSGSQHYPPGTVSIYQNEA